MEVLVRERLGVGVGFAAMLEARPCLTSARPGGQSRRLPRAAKSNNHWPRHLAAREEGIRVEFGEVW